MANTGEILINLLKVEGITSAAIVGRDGFVIEAAEDSQANIEAVGAVVTAAFNAADSMGGELDTGAMTQIMAEFERGIVIAAAIEPDVVLAIVTGSSSNLGNIRYQVKKYVRELQTSTYKVQS
jgi:hypothetical protein